jgi:hypothetical protein
VHRNSAVSTGLSVEPTGACENDGEGMIKIIATPSGTILGSTIVEERAGESIMEVVMAMENKLKVSDLASRIHPSPTYNSGIQLLATEVAVERSHSGFSGTLLRTVRHMVAAANLFTPNLPSESRPWK